MFSEENCVQRQRIHTCYPFFITYFLFQVSKDESFIFDKDLKKSAVWLFGTNRFSCWQVIFHSHLPDGQEPKQVSWQLNTKRLNQG